MQTFYIDVMTGHKVDDEDKAYDLIQENPEELRHVYLEHIHAITILNGNNNVKTSVKELKDGINVLKTNIAEKDQRITKLEEKLEAVKGTINEVNQIKAEIAEKLDQCLQIERLIQKSPELLKLLQKLEEGGRVRAET